MWAAPCREAFSAFQSSSRSEYSFSSPCKISFERRETLALEASSFSFLQSHLLDLQLNDAALEPVERLGLRIDFQRGCAPPPRR
jgi:hypothetical protein